MSQCYCYSFLDTLEVVWNKDLYRLLMFQAQESGLIFAKNCFVYFNNFSNLLSCYLFQNRIFITCMLIILMMAVLMNNLWEKKNDFLRLCQTLHSFRASSVKRCRKNTYERVIFNFNCTVLKFYSKYFCKVFHKTMGAAFSRVINIG